jgi:hypothetical protein
VLTGRTQGAFTCVAYQSFHRRKQNWTTGWLPTSSLAPVEPSSRRKWRTGSAHGLIQAGRSRFRVARVGN